MKFSKVTGYLYHSTPLGSISYDDLPEIAAIGHSDNAPNSDMSPTAQTYQVVNDRVDSLSSTECV